MLTFLKLSSQIKTVSALLNCLLLPPTRNMARESTIRSQAEPWERGRPMLGSLDFLYTFKISSSWLRLLEIININQQSYCHES
ncbi:MAG: hypothetical protein EBE86_030575 [Hormoscilla sp. GUM202]|nr:hypothetical protein [Hormoscilla sp. GUM202]